MPNDTLGLLTDRPWKPSLMLLFQLVPGFTGGNRKRSSSKGGGVCIKKTLYWQSGEAPDPGLGNYPSLSGGALTKTLVTNSFDCEFVVVVPRVTT